VAPLDEREKRVTLWAAAFGAVSAVAFYAPAFDLTAALVLALVGVVMAVLLALAGRSGSRLFTCVAAGLLGIGPWGYAYIIGLPFLLLAGWLLYRDANTRRAARERAVRERRTREVPAKEKPVKEERVRQERMRARRVKQRPVKRAKERKPAKETPSKPSRPRASKRYTPPAGRR